MSDDYVIRESRHDEITKVIDFLEEHHTKEDVIAQGLAKKRTDQMSPELLEKSVVEFFEKYRSFVVMKGDEIVGAVVLFPSEDDMKDKDLSGLEKELDDAIIKVYVDSSLYKKYNPKKMMKIRKLGVHREHRGRGLAKRLIKASVDWSKRNKYETVFSLFSTPAAKKAAENVGFVKYLDFDVRMLKDSKGEQLLGDCSPNNVIGLMVREI